MITDAAGVIRPTFYNYFQDKYEVMEWLLWENVFKDVSELIKADKGMDALKLLFQKFDEDEVYYEKVFEVTGQNSFEEMLYQQILHIEEILIEHHPLKHLEDMPHISEKVFLEFHAVTLMNGIKYWIKREKGNVSAEDALEFYRYMMAHSVLDLLETGNEENRIKKK